jgi:serine O-acetyltransferase
MLEVRRNFTEQVVRAFGADVQAWRDTGWPMKAGFKGGLILLFTSNGLRATLIYRLGRWATVSRIPLLPTFLQQLNISLHGIEIYSSVDIAPGLYMPHTVGSVVFAKRIGRGVTLQGGITVGQASGPGNPVIEERAFLGAGCRVLGPIQIGEGATVGANAVVLDTVPAGAVAVGVPARIIARSADVQAVTTDSRDVK